MTELTRREREIRGYLCTGWSNKEIARKLGLSIRTVEDHRCNILKKYGARNMVDVMRQVYGLTDEVVG